jgi:hypothetical protein
MDRGIFFDEARKRLKVKTLSQSQVDGFEFLITYALNRRTPLMWFAYILATSWHETGRTMQPVRETLADTDAKAVARLDRAFKAGKLGSVSKPYWRFDQDGKTWLGRGLVQITHKYNYEVMDSLIPGADLVKDPNRAMLPEIAAEIMFTGLELGSFTRFGLKDFVDVIDDDDAKDRAEFKAARKTVNGRDKADKIADYAIAFEHALRVAGYPEIPVPKASAPAPAPVVPPPPAPKPAEPVPTPAAIERQPATANWLEALLMTLAKIFGGTKS